MRTYHAVVVNFDLFIWFYLIRFVLFDTAILPSEIIINTFI